MSDRRKIRSGNFLRRSADWPELKNPHTNCRPGMGICDKCAVGDYENCRYKDQPKNKVNTDDLGASMILRMVREALEVPDGYNVVMAAKTARIKAKKFDSLSEILKEFKS